VIMSLGSLLISGDTTVQRVLRPTLEKLSITLEVCSTLRSGSDLLLGEKFDAIIVDCDDLEGGTQILQGLRKTPSNKNSIAFAILNGKTTTQQAFEMGANFVLQKPISPLNASRCFNAAFTLMDRERRRYFRHPVEMAVVITFTAGNGMKATSTDISEGGMAISFRGPMPKEPISKVQFTLPGTTVTLEPKAEVAWADGTGHAGLRFQDMADSAKHKLETWLGERLEKALISRGERKPSSPTDTSR
jgi:CheY-like chemotaxis protein